MSVLVNGTEIDESEIAAEMQYHPADSADQAWDRAATALVIREILRQEAARTGAADGLGDELSADDGAIEALLAREIVVPAADDDTCRRYFEANRRRFRTPDAYLADHILIAVPPEDRAGRDAAKARAAAWISRIVEEPSAMAGLAGRFSDCPSKSDGGSLGWIERGQTVPEFETYLFSLEPGEVCGLPIETRYGVHVIRLNDRRAGTDLPLDAVRPRISDYLHYSVRRRAIHQYISVLLGRSRIEGIDLGTLPDTPLVQ